MNILFDCVNFNSTAGPSWFARKLAAYLKTQGHEINGRNPDVQLSFVFATQKNEGVPIFQRLDGIWYNAEVDYTKMNEPLNKTYDIADGVIFQSEWSRRLVESQFGACANYTVIPNGADIEQINRTDAATGLDDYEKVWLCASSWEGEPPNNAPRYIKRLEENIRYFQEHSGARDVLCVAGEVSYLDNPDPVKIIFFGDLAIDDLFPLYKRADYFLHLGRLDNCPNVVIDARAAGCQIICSSLGGTQEVAGKDAIVIEEDEWDFTPFAYNVPTRLDFSRKRANQYDRDISIACVAAKYLDFFSKSI